MEPLSVALTAITLATALKDIVETSKAIQDSFSKLPRNFRNARKLAEETFTTLQEMQDIYDDNMANFNGTEPLIKAVSTLQVQMKAVHEQCLGLIPPVNEKKRKKFKIAFYAFWNRKKLEQLISELNDQVDRCSQRFLISSSIRTEALVVEMHGRYASGGSAGLHSTMYLPMTRIADVVPRHDRFKACLRREIGVLDRSLQSIFSLWLQEFPAEFEVPPLTVSYFLKEPPLPDSLVQQKTVSLASDIQSLLKDSPSGLWIRSVDSAIDRLCQYLSDLWMHEDAIAIATLRVNFWNVVVGRLPESSTSLHHLADSLTKLSSFAQYIGDRRQIHLNTEKAMNVIGKLPSAARGIYDFMLMGQNLILQSKIEEDQDKRSKFAIGAGKILGIAHDALVSNNFLAVTQSSSALCITNSPAATDLAAWSANEALTNIDENIPHDNQFAFAIYLLSIAKIQLNHNQFSESNTLAKSALATLRRLHGIYPGSRRILHAITTVYEHLLAYRSMRKLSSAMVNLEYAQENATIVRDLAQQINPQKYVLLLLRALSYKREILLNADRLSEAQKVFRDMTNLRDLAKAPRHLDIRIPSDVEGDYYYQIAELHLTSQRPTETMLEAQNAVRQYSALGFMDPGRNPIKLFGALALLCKSLIAMEKYDDALERGFEALEILGRLTNIHGSNSYLIEAYYELLGGMMEALAASESGTLSQAMDIDERIRSISPSVKITSKWKVAHAPVKYAELLEKSMRLKEAASYLEDIYTNWGTQIYGDFNDSKMSAVHYIRCLRKLQNILKDIGEPERALFYDKVITSVAHNFQSKLGNDPNNFFSFALLKTTTTRINLLCDAGLYTEALDLSLTMLSNAHNQKSALDPEDATTGVVQALFYHSLMQSHNDQPQDAIDAAKEAVNLCDQKLPNDKSSTFDSLYISLIALCNGYSDNGDVDEALLQLDRADQAAQKKNKNVYSTEQLKESNDGSYEAILTQRSKLLFAKGRHSEAADLIKRVEIYQRVYCKTNKTGVRNLVATLYYSGIVYCTLGRYEEGGVAVTELKNLMEETSSVFLGLARVIRRKLDFMTNRGAWKSVREAKAKLQCPHQHEY